MAKKDNYRRWEPAARRLIDEHGSVEEALAYAFPRFEDTGLELRLELDKRRVAGLRQDHDHMVLVLGDVERWKKKAFEDPKEFDLILDSFLKSLKLVLRTICYRPSRKPRQNMVRDREVYQIYLDNRSQIDDPANIPRSFSWLAKTYNSRFKPPKPVTRQDAERICKRQRQQAVEHLAEYISRIFPHIPSNEPPPPALPQ